MGGAVRDAKCGGFVRVRVFSKKLLRRGGVHFGWFWGAPSRAWARGSAGLERATGRALPGEGKAAWSGGWATGIPRWGCGDIGDSVHSWCTKGKTGARPRSARGTGVRFAAAGKVEVYAIRYAHPAGMQPASGLPTR